MAHRRFISAVGSGLLVLLAAGTAYAAGPYAYFTHYWLNQVSVVDTTSGSVIVTLDVGNEPGGIAATATRVYVTNTGSDSVSVLDTATNAVVATIPVGGAPFGIAAEPSGQRVWVGNQTSRTLSVIDAATNAVVATVALAGSPIGVAVHPAGTWVLVTTGQGNLEMVSTASLSVVHTLQIGGAIGGVAVSPDGSRAWVPYHSTVGGRVAVVDTATPKVETTVAVPMFPFGVAVDPQGNRVYVASASTASVSVLDAKNPAEVARINGLGWGLWGLTVHPSAPELWVADEANLAAFVIDTTTHQSRTVMLPAESTSFGNFIAAPASQGCNDGLDAAVEAALARVEEAMRRTFHGDFAVKGETPAARVGRFATGVRTLNLGHRNGIYQNLARVQWSAGAPDPQICNEALRSAVQAALATIEDSLRDLNRNFRLPGSGLVERLQHVSDAVARLDRGRLQGLYWTLQ